MDQMVAGETNGKRREYEVTPCKEQCHQQNHRAEGEKP